ncbi:PstS family phosphate ABC transporter substrate-binding protein [Pseudomarimonas salicorniae]|uniref:Phosphate-binding protein n=1 Tax=Pseudomarimonas salicorniae TaxID=2933270 RepID=A0ABT0GIG5_9GAMM|nr:PstS family phosphate ABC transporter substrate-binding protein [Lysobacter sp. CAU 1642]MCK7594337.1 PstS family phosphate ABC transporter substrate-binding protein [Lysobacter sp. CAU 1642]
MNAFRPLLALSITLALAACGQKPAEGEAAAPAAAKPAEVPIIEIDGSSTVYPITEAVAEEYQIAEQGKVRVTVGVSGTGGGFKKFCRGETTISNASRPILDAEIEACRTAGVQFIELPVAFDAVTVAVNPQNTWLEAVTVEELKKMWEPEAQGVVLKWNQVNPAWPDAEMKLFGAGADSGTFDYFTEAVVGKAKASRGDFTASEDDNVLVTGVASDPNALGFFGFAYYRENQDKLRAVPVKATADGAGVLPSMETVLDGTYTPMSRPIFIYVNAKDAAERPEVRAFVEFYLKESQALITEVGYIPLPDRAYELASERVANNVTGTVFEGHAEVGVSVESLLQRETRQ